MSNLKDNTNKRIDFQRALVQKHGETGVVPIISIENFDRNEHKPGVVFEAHPKVAAAMVFNHTHRLASVEEHERYKQELADRTDTLEKMEAERRIREGKSVVISGSLSNGPSGTELALATQLGALQAELAALREGMKAQKPEKPVPPVSKGDK